jgi:hypothetical protein
VFHACATHDRYHFDDLGVPIDADLADFLLYLIAHHASHAEFVYY